MEPACDGYDYDLVMKIMWVAPAAFTIPSLVFTILVVVGLKNPTLRVLSFITFSLRVIFLYMVEIASRLVDSYDDKLYLPSRDYSLTILSFSVLICYVLALRLPSKSLKQDVWASAILVASRVQRSFKSPFKLQNDIILSCMLVVSVVLFLRAYLAPLRRDSSFLQQQVGGGEEEKEEDTIIRCYGIAQSDEDIDWLLKFRTVVITFAWLSASNRSRLNFVAHTACLVASVVLAEAVVESLWFPVTFDFYMCSSSGFRLTDLVMPFILIVNSILFSIVLIVWSVPVYLWWFKHRNNVEEEQETSLLPDLQCFTSHLKSRKITKVVQMVMHRIYVEVSKYVKDRKVVLLGNLISLLGMKSSLGFVGVRNLHLMVPSPNPEEKQQQVPNCWVLYVFALKSIAIGLPGISQDRLDVLLRSVSEGICYATLIDDVLDLSEGPNPTLFNMVEAAILDFPILLRPFGRRILRSQHRFARKFRYNPTKRWLGANLRELVSRTATVKEALEKFRELAKSKFTASAKGNESSNKMSPLNFTNLFLWSPQDFAAYSMYTLCQYFLDPERSSELSSEAIFGEIEGTVADIFGYCITRYPRLIKSSSSSSEFFADERIIKGVTSVLARSSKLRDQIWFMQMPPRSNCLVVDTAVQGSVVCTDGGGPPYSSENSSSPDEKEEGLEIDVDVTVGDDDDDGDDATTDDATAGEVVPQ